MDIQKGKNFAIASLILGIISIALSFIVSFIFLPIISVVCGIVGIVLASMSKKYGFTDGLRTVGLILSIIGLVLGVIGLICAIVCVATVAVVSDVIENEIGAESIESIAESGGEALESLLNSGKEALESAAGSVVG